MRRAHKAGIVVVGLAMSGVAEAYFQISAPYRFDYDGATIRFDQVSIVETVMPCARTRAQLVLQVRATAQPFDPVTRQGHLIAETHLGAVGPPQYGCPRDAFDVVLPVSPPPPGRYEVTVVVFAAPSPGKWCVSFRYCVEDWKTLPQPLVVGVPAAVGAR